jgi:hypothetical protein
MPRIYGKRFDGKILEVQNHPARKTGDVMVMQALSDTQVEKVEDLRADGRSDTQIWRSLHPEQIKSAKNVKKTGAFALKLEQLTKEQLILLIENSTKESIESLSKMTSEDLIKLIRNFGNVKPTRVTISR